MTMGSLWDAAMRALGLPAVVWLNACVLAAAVATAWVRLFVWAGRPDALDDIARGTTRVRTRRVGPPRNPAGPR